MPMPTKNSVMKKSRTTETWRTISALNGSAAMVMPAMSAATPGLTEMPRSQPNSASSAVSRFSPTRTTPKAQASEATRIVEGCLAIQVKPMGST